MSNNFSQHNIDMKYITNIFYVNYRKITFNVKLNPAEYVLSFLSCFSHTISFLFTAAG